jgi:FKBP-type peptidyl-prolyl cis-trans isomerase (trigger factor)
MQKYADDGEKVLEQIREISVPETMLETHVKALKLATYASDLNSDMIQYSEQDPIRTIKNLSHAQAFLRVAFDFISDIQVELAEYGIEEIPLDL